MTIYRCKYILQKVRLNFVEDEICGELCKELHLLQPKLADHLLADRVHFYPLCANCVTRVETVGGPPPKKEKVSII
jgi:CRISPR/Cas system-associated endoribonuclease Cas2